MLANIKDHLNLAGARVKGAALAARDKATDAYEDAADAVSDRLTHPNIAYERGVKDAIEAVQDAVTDQRPIDAILFDGIIEELEEHNPY